jgi:hypothetical protein
MSKRRNRQRRLTKWQRKMREERRKAQRQRLRAKRAQAVVDAPKGMFVCSWHGSRRNPGWERGRQGPGWSTLTEAERHQAAIDRISGK